MSRHEKKPFVFDALSDLVPCKSGKLEKSLGTELPMSQHGDGDSSPV